VLSQVGRGCWDIAEDFDCTSCPHVNPGCEDTVDLYPSNALYAIVELNCEYLLISLARLCSEF
jgi:hypothetical protein